MSDWYEANKEAARDSRERLELPRMNSTRHELVRRGCKVSPGPDHKSFTVVFPNGKRFNFWPYSGWFAGKTQGRGFASLLAAGGIVEKRGEGNVAGESHPRV